MIWLYALGFVAVAVVGFIYGKKVHLKQLASVLYRLNGFPNDQVDKVIHLVSQYKKIAKQAKKDTEAAYKQALVTERLEKLKKEDDK